LRLWQWVSALFRNYKCVAIARFKL
jgi:hypothetical protein